MLIGSEQLTSVFVFGNVQTTATELAPVRHGIRLGKKVPQAVSSPTMAWMLIDAMPSLDSVARAVMVEVWFSAR